MKELEVKILNINRKEVISKLVKLGAKKQFDSCIKASLFDFPDRRMLKNKKTVRVRTVGSKVFLTFKAPLPGKDIKIREEFEIEVSDFDTAKKILESLGLSERISMSKHRTSYELKGVHFELDKHTDQFSYVPEFLEIEATSKKKIYQYVKLLGFKKEDCRPWTVLDIVKHMRSK